MDLKMRGERKGWKVNRTILLSRSSATLWCDLFVQLLWHLLRRILPPQGNCATVYQSQSGVNCKSLRAVLFFSTLTLFSVSLNCSSCSMFSSLSQSHGCSLYFSSGTVMPVDLCSICFYAVKGKMIGFGIIWRLDGFYQTGKMDVWVFKNWNVQAQALVQIEGPVCNKWTFWK